MSESDYNKKSFRAEDIARLKKLIDEGCLVLQEMEDLRTGLSETVKAIAEELEIKPGQLNKAIKVAYKRSFGEERAKLDEVEDILDATGRKQ